MISDLIEFGKWLDENNQDDFGKLVQDDDRVIKVNVKYHDGTLEFKDLNSIIKDSIDNYDSIKTYNDYKQENDLSFSLFSNQLFFETNQNVMIPSNDAFACLTPFVVSLKRITNTKIKKSKKRNEDGLEFINLISELKNNKSNLANYYDDYGRINKLNSNRLLFNKTLENAKMIIEVIKQYYGLLYDNYEMIEDLKNKITGRDPDIFLYFELPDEFLLFNDMVYFYCKYLKQRAETVDESKINIENPTNCQFCGADNISFVKFSSIGIGFGSYNWNYTTGLQDSKLKICKNCSAYLYLAVQKLIHVFEKYFILIPRLKTSDENDFKFITTELNSYYKEVRSKRSKFVLLNKFMSNSDYNRYFNFDFLIFDKTRMGEDIDTIKKYVENYKAYLANFEKKKIILYKDKKLNYLFGEELKVKDNLFEIKNIFDVEYILKNFFIYINDDRIKYPNLNHFYEIYTKDISGKTGIFPDSDSKTVSLFARYMHAIFDLIYELNEESLERNMLNEILSNCLINLEKNLDDPRFNILKLLNYYFALKIELLGDRMLKEKNVQNIKDIFFKYGGDSKEPISEEDHGKILELIKDDPGLKYYLLGKFLKNIDSLKWGGGKKSEVFNNFITNANRNNIKNLFVTEVLQKNNYYIEKMNKKSKFTFNLLESDINALFNEPEGFSFEDYLLLLFTGYYTKNILSKSFGPVKEGDD
jgi:CRISPR-associated protein Csh1